MLKEFQYRIYYEDTDLGGVVYYANYLKFFERARTDFLREKGILQSELIQEYKMIFVVKNCLIKYIKPAKLDDLITVKVIIEKLKVASIKIRQIISANNQALCELEIEVVCVDSGSFKPKRIPFNIYNLIEI